jgi:hypothetical protein
VETSLGVEAREVPFKYGSVTVDVLVPCLSLEAQGFQVGYSAFAQTLPGKQADLDFGLIEPTGMLGSVVEGESLPKSLSSLDRYLVYLPPGISSRTNGMPGFPKSRLVQVNPSRISLGYRHKTRS